MDTNVLVSGILNPSGKPAIILNHVIHKNIQMALESRIFHEYHFVLKREKFSLDPAAIDVLLDYLQHTAQWLTPNPYLGKLKDEGDRPFVESALTIGIPLVTGNLKHYQNIPNLKILTPGQYLDTL